MGPYSVLMSLYRKENPDYLRQAIDSMINQTVKPDEIVIVEDGPLTQELHAVVKDYVTRYPELFKIIINEKNLGLGLALNKGINACKNELIARMDTDDISRPQRCEKQLKRFQERPDLSIVGTWVDEFDRSPDQVVSTRMVPLESQAIYIFAKKRSAFNHPAVMYRKSRVLENGGYGDLRRNQDVDLFGRMLFHGCLAENIDESLLLFRSDENLARRRKSWENTKSYILTIRKFWKMGYAGLGDYLLVLVAQTGMFLFPVKVQQWIYKKFLRK
ncbi:MAG: glycosyltransferase [Lachnospiraceae bacterium]|jgi:glycosyltransferase involved in cell wall biosynthesis|nr:glycosyltransferase [Lachnospiraceae bacterium]